jgi:phage tail sheath gpL-like
MSDIPIPNLPSNVRVPLFYASVDPSKANTLQQDHAALIIGQITASGTLTPPAPISATTNATTAAGNPTLHFAAGPSASIQPGDVITDSTAPTAIAAGTTVLSIDFTAHTVTMSANAAGPGVGGTDTIVFTRPFVAKPYLASSVLSAAGLAGPGSQIARMVASFKRQNLQTTVYILPMQDDGAAVKATGFVDVSGTPTAAGTVALYIAGKLVPTLVTTAMTAAQIATALAAAITADVTLPVTAAAVSTRVTLTAKNGGAVGNSIDVRKNYFGAAGGEADVAGVAVAITPMSGGATNPSTALTTALAALAAKAYDYVIHPYTDAGSLNAIRDWLGDVSGQWSPTKQFYGGAFTAALGTSATLQTLGLARNDPHHSIGGIYDCPTDPMALAGALGGFAALTLSSDPSIPARDVALIGILPPPESSQFQFADNNTLLWSGISTFKTVGGQLFVQRLITTYQLNTFGSPDNSMLSVEKMFTLAEGLRLQRGMVEGKYNRVKLASDGTRLPPEARVVTPLTVRADLIGFYDAELVKKRAWFQDTDAFAAGLVVQRNSSDPDRLDVLWDSLVIDQLNIFALLVQFRQVA